MAKKTAGAKSSKKGRTKVKNLPVGEKELAAAEKKKVKGGLLSAFTLTTPGTTANSPSLTATGVTKTGDLGSGDFIMNQDFIMKK